MKIDNRVFISVVLPVSLGFILYYLFCPEVIFVRVIDSAVQCGIHIEYGVESIWKDLVRGYLLDFLWACAFGSSIYFLTRGLFCTLKVSILLPVLCGMGMELAQMNNLVTGAADIMDVFVEAIGTTAAVIFLRRTER